MPCEGARRWKQAPLDQRVASRPRINPGPDGQGVSAPFSASARSQTRHSTSPCAKQQLALAEASVLAIDAQPALPLYGIPVANKSNFRAGLDIAAWRCRGSGDCLAGDDVEG